MDFPYESDFARTCRTCLYQADEVEELSAVAHEFSTELHSIYEYPPGEWEVSSEQIVKLLKSIVPQLELPTTEDGGGTLPQMMCDSCLELLRQAHGFQQMCIAVDAQMQQMLQCYYDAMEVKSSLPTDEREGGEHESQLEFVVEEEVIEEDEEKNVGNVEEVKIVALEANESNKEKVALQLGDFEVEEQQELDLDEELEDLEEERLYEDYEQSEAGFLSDELEDFSDEQLDTALVERKSKRTRQNSDSYFESLLIEEHLSDADYVEEKESASAEEEQLGLQRSSKNTIVLMYKCDTCSQSFAREQTLRKHKETQHNPIQYACHTCGKQYASKRTAREHQRRYHAEDDIPQQFVCEVCKKAYNNALLLKAHMRLHKMTHLCSLCGRGFGSASNLKQHLYRHDGVIRFECAECPKKFSNLPDLYGHKAAHRKLKQHVCEICGAAFGTAYTLKLHMRYHTDEKPFQCEYCDMRFITATYLRCHMRKHTGDKPFKCKYCGNNYRLKHGLMKHMRAHLGENVYRCELCPRLFRLASERREHFVTHKDDDEATRQANLQLIREEDERLMELAKKVE